MWRGIGKPSTPQLCYATSERDADRQGVPRGCARGIARRAKAYEKDGFAHRTARPRNEAGRSKMVARHRGCEIPRASSSRQVAPIRQRPFPRTSGRRGECNRCGAGCEILFKCPFLRRHADGTTSCGIYSDRPNQCRLFPIDWRDLEEVRGRCSYHFVERPVQVELMNRSSLES